ncbi:MAG: family N-acetyltransferase, partial [Bacillota bacterium]|nr:family N-acetyltransferase [Bacillota bacterium]
MSITNNFLIKLKENLNKNDYADINNLKNICMDYDKTYLKLEIDFKLREADKNSNYLKLINEFMFYNDNKLIGYAGICSFGGDALEVNGMVHPDYRRKGIFTRLFSLVKDEFSKRNSTEMLLLSDNSSIGGIEFIKNVCSDYDHSEYDMNLDMAVIHDLNFNDLIFKKLTYEDVNKISKEKFEFFNEHDYEGISDSEKNGCNSVSCTYIIEIDNAVVGKVRLEINNNIGGIYGLEVLPYYRGKGYGRELLIQSIKKIKESNVKTITLQVEANNKNALNLYKSCGFKENYTMDY